MGNPPQFAVRGTAGRGIARRRWAPAVAFGLCLLGAAPLATPRAALAAPGTDAPAERKAAPPRPAGSEAEVRAARARAAEFLRKIESEKPGPARYKLVDLLIELGDAAWPVVDAAMPKLIGLTEGEAVVVDLLLGFMPTSYDRVVATAPTLGDEGAWRVVKFALRLSEDERQTALLAAMLPRTDERILLAVVPPLVARSHDAVFPRLIALVDESRPQLAAFAVDVIAANRHAPALPALVRLFGIEERRATTANLQMRTKLIHAIARIGGEAAVSPLMEGLGLADQRQAIKEGLREVGAPAVKAALFLLRTASGSRLVVALELLASLRLDAAPELVAMLASGDSATRELAVDVLSYLGVADVRGEVVRFVRDRKPGDLGPLLRLCSSLYDDEVRRLFFELLENPNPAVRSQVIDALWRLRDPKTFAVLRLLAAQDRDNGVRIHAIRAVAGVGDPKGMDFLRKMTRAPHHAVKIALIEEIGQSDQWQTALPALMPMLGDPDDAVFRAALAAIERLTMHTGPRRAAPWGAWLAAETARQPEPFEATATREVRFVVDDREMSVVSAGSGSPIVVVSGPPFRDATHLMPWVWQLADDHEVHVMRRAPWPYRASRSAGAAQWDRELSAMLARTGHKRVVLMADAAGAAAAMRYAAAHKDAIASVILMGGPWPTADAIEAAPAQVLANVPPAAMVDVDWGLGAGWRYPGAVARRVVMRGLLHSLVASPAAGRRMAMDNLADDAFEPILLQRLREETVDFDPGLTPQRVLVVLGDKAPWVKTSAEALAFATKRSKGRVRVARIPGASALPLADAPKPTLEAIGAFLGD